MILPLAQSSSRTSVVFQSVRKLSRWLAVGLLVLAVGLVVKAEDESKTNEVFSGGATTVFDGTAEAFSFSARNLSGSHRAAFMVGHSFFNENWLAASASVS